MRARIVSGPRSRALFTSSYRRAPGARGGARGPGQRESGRLRRGAFSAVGAPRRPPPVSLFLPSFLVSPPSRTLSLSLSSPISQRSPSLSFSLSRAQPLSLSRSQVIYRAANSIFSLPPFIIFRPIVLSNNKSLHFVKN